MTKRVVIPKLVQYISSMDCAACSRLGFATGSPVEVHHKNSKGMGVRSGDDKAIPLCYLHHRGELGVHHMGTRRWELENKFTEEELLHDTIRRI